MVFTLYFWLVSMIGGIGYFIWWERRRPKRNSLGWRHPDNGGGLEWFWSDDIELRLPFLIKYDFWSIFFRPVYIWKQGKKETGEGYEWKEYEPANAGGLAPNGLYDLVDWECSREFEAASTKLMEAVKLGVGLAMLGICLFGIMVVLDMIGKGGA